MSDGENATPGRRAPEPHGDNQWITRTPRPKPDAAPWERTPDPESAPRSGRAGNPRDGITVADLIARVTGDVPPALQQAADDPEPAADDAALADAIEAADESDLAEVADATELTDVVDMVEVPDEPVEDDPPTVVLSAYAAEIPDLDDEPATTVLEAVSAPPPGRVRPAHIGRRTTGPTTPHDPHSRRRKTVRYAGRAVAALLAVMALVVTGGAWQWTTSKNNRMNNIAALDPNSRDILDPNAQFGDENFLIVGVDSRYGQNSDMGAGDTADADGARSDSIILVNIPANRERVVAVSFPRDLAITPIQCDVWNASTGEYGPIYDEASGTYGPEEVYTETKLNSTYAFGGPKCLVKAIQKMSGLSINRFMAVDFAGFAKMVDALGGVEVCTTTPLEDYELGTILPTAGRQMVDGTTALNYVRARQVTTEVNGDYGRIKRQQLFLSSLLRSLISKETFFSLSKLNNVVNMFINDSSVDNVSTKDLVDLGQSLQGVSAGRITFVTVPTTGYADEWGNEQPRTADIRALFDAIIDDDPLPGENDQNATIAPMTNSSALAETPEPSATGTSAAPDPATDGTEEPATTTEVVHAVTTEPDEISVHVANSTSIAGLGSAASAELQAHGFVVDTPDDYSEALPATTVMYSPGNEHAAATVAAAFGEPRIERVTGLGQEVQVVLGPDYGMVLPPPPSGSPMTVTVAHVDRKSTPTYLPEDLTITNGADVSCE
ncbi:LCP family protein [[Mycobacterium] wendilense]|uniref:LCP family protein n=1 Tax=[Mycobacterium] wendilense TaxID=3064284 RepID=A0ABN9NYH6_9MYCO|nr:LCP family protein [Mycolicibacterium sp. MU0050]CAJ1579718.1 LCP family protein [Mycolicibacterium sp. MU0050]